jgi:hypothetical protein
MREFIRDSAQILSIETAERFLFDLVRECCAYHLDEDPADITRGDTGQPLFTPEESHIVWTRAYELRNLPSFGPFENEFDLLFYVEATVRLESLTEEQISARFDEFVPDFDTSDGRYDAVALLEWNDRGGDYIGLSDNELREIWNRRNETC